VFHCCGDHFLFAEFELRFLNPGDLISRKITYKHSNGCVHEVHRLQSVKIKAKRERMNHGCNRTLNVFQLTPPLYYNSGVCQYKRGAASYLYIFGAVFSDCNNFSFAD
jgi:hypothetical protein